MKHSDFSIGLEFVASGFIWRCTDTGTRTITAIRIEDGRNQSWYNGPPYVVSEVVFDEYDLPNCYRSEDEADTSGLPIATDGDVKRRAQNCKWLAQVESEATDVFCSQAKAKRWLASENKALGCTPRSLLNTENGVAEVRQVLNAIAYGGVV